MDKILKNLKETWHLMSESSGIIQWVEGSSSLEDFLNKLKGKSIKKLLTVSQDQSFGILSRDFYKMGGVSDEGRALANFLSAISYQARFKAIGKNSEIQGLRNSLEEYSEEAEQSRREKLRKLRIAYKMDNEKEKREVISIINTEHNENPSVVAMREINDKIQEIENYIENTATIENPQELLVADKESKYYENELRNVNKIKELWNYITTGEVVKDVDIDVDDTMDDAIVERKSLDEKRKYIMEWNKESIEGDILKNLKEAWLRMDEESRKPKRKIATKASDVGKEVGYSNGVWEVWIGKNRGSKYDVVHKPTAIKLVGMNRTLDAKKVIDALVKKFGDLQTKEDLLAALTPYKDDITNMGIKQKIEGFLTKLFGEKNESKFIEGSDANNTMQISIPVSLAEEAKMAMEETWENSVVSEKVGKVYDIEIKKETADEFLQGLLSTIDVALGDKGVPLKDLSKWEKSSRLKAKKWAKEVVPQIRVIKRSNPDTSFRMTQRYLQWF